MAMGIFSTSMARQKPIRNIKNVAPETPGMRSVYRAPPRGVPSWILLTCVGYSCAPSLPAFCRGTIWYARRLPPSKSVSARWKARQSGARITTPAGVLRLPRDLWKVNECDCHRHGFGVCACTKPNATGGLLVCTSNRWPTSFSRCCSSALGVHRRRHARHTLTRDGRSSPLHSYSAW